MLKKELESYNANAWGHQSILNFFDAHRLKSTDIYPSEWFFLQKKLREGMSILDIGCAKGGFANALAEHINDFTYVGVDINKDMIKAAKDKYPQHTFHVIDNDYAVLAQKRYDLVICLGILHLHESWRETLRIAWEHTKTDLIFDLRETHLATIEDKNKSYFKTDFDNVENPQSNYILPYNIINVGDALTTVHAVCNDARKISHFGYTQKVSALCVSPIKEVMANVYCIER